MVTFRFPTWLVWAILFRTSGKFGDFCFSLADFSPRFRSLLCWFSWLSTLRIDIYQCSSPLFFFSVCVFLLYFWGVMLMIFWLENFNCFLIDSRLSLVMYGPGVITLSPSVGAYKATCRLASQKQFMIDLTVKLYTRVYYEIYNS